MSRVRRGEQPRQRDVDERAVDDAVDLVEAVARIATPAATGTADNATPITTRSQLHPSCGLIHQVGPSAMSQAGTAAPYAEHELELRRSSRRARRSRRRTPTPPPSAIHGHREQPSRARRSRRPGPPRPRCRYGFSNWLEGENGPGRRIAAEVNNTVAISGTATARASAATAAARPGTAVPRARAAARSAGSPDSTAQAADLGTRPAMAGVLIKRGRDGGEHADDAEDPPDAVARDPRTHDRERQTEHEEPETPDAAEEVVLERAIGTEREQHQSRRGSDQHQDEPGSHGGHSLAGAGAEAMAPIRIANRCWHGRRVPRPRR